MPRHQKVAIAREVDHLARGLAGTAGPRTEAARALGLDVGVLSAGTLVLRDGQVVAFGGRVLDDGTPKYLNSPETGLFQRVARDGACRFGRVAPAAKRRARFTR